MTSTVSREEAVLLKKLLIAEEKKRRAQQQRFSSPLYTATTLDPNYHARPHLQVISDAMTRISEGHDNAVIIVCPPQSGKSVTAAVWTPLWWLINHPTHRVIVASYSEGLAVKRGKAIRTLIDQNSEKIGISIRYGSSAATDWDLTTNGGLKSVGVGSGLTGHPGDLLILDDPHKDRSSADSVVQREAVNDWYSSTFLTRRSPGAPVIIILTRWNADDQAGRLIKEEGLKPEGGRWNLIHMPALCSDPTTDPIGRSLGGPLPHPKVDPEDTATLLGHWEEARARATVRDWYALYQGDPQPLEGALLTAAQIREQRCYQPTAKPIKKAVAIDPSGGGRDSAGIIGGWLGDDKRLYLTHDATLTGPVDTWARKACMLAADIGADIIFVEYNFGAGMAVFTVRTAWEALKAEGYPGTESLSPAVEAVRAKLGKVLRAEPVAQQFTTDRIRLATYMPDLEQEWQTWQSTNPDSPGRIDASVVMAYGLLPVPGRGMTVVSTHSRAPVLPTLPIR